MAVPTVADVYGALNSVLRNDPASQNVPEWTEAELLVYISDAAREAQRQLKMIDQSFGTDQVTFDIVSGQQKYTADDMGITAEAYKAPLCLYRNGIGPKPVPVRFIKHGWPEYNSYLQTDYLNGQLCFAVMLVGDGDLWPAPIPTENVTGGLTLLFEKLIVPPGGYTTTGDDLEFPQDWLEFIRWDAAAKAKRQDETNPGPMWEQREIVRKSLRADFANRLTGQEAETVRSTYTYGAGYGTTPQGWT